MHRWASAVLALAFVVGIAPGAAQAQSITNPLCQQSVYNTVLPVLRAADAFNPGGQFPVGYWPLMQPFGSSPNETAYTAYPSMAYYSSYATPAWAQRAPTTYPASYPGQGALPGLYPPDVAGQLGQDPNPTLTSAGILGRLQGDGTFDRLSPTEQADWLFRLASLQRDEINQRFTQASLQQNAENTMLNLRTRPLEISLLMQERSRNWRDSYGQYANTLVNLYNSVGCTGAAAAGVGGGGTGTGFVGPNGILFTSVAACQAANGAGAVCLPR